MRIGRRSSTARAAGRVDPRAVGKSRIPSRIAWWSASLATAATRRRLPSGSIRSMRQKSARSGIEREAAAWIVSSRSRVSSRRRPGVGDETGDVGSPACAPRCRRRSRRTRGTRRRGRGAAHRCRGPSDRPRRGGGGGIRPRTGPAARTPHRAWRGVARRRPGGRVDPAVADLVLERSAGELEPAPIEERVAAVETGHPDEHRGVVGQVAELALASRRASDARRSSSMSVAVPIQPWSVPASPRSGTTRRMCQRNSPSWRRRRTVASRARSPRAPHASAKRAPAARPGGPARRSRASRTRPSRRCTRASARSPRSSPRPGRRTRQRPAGLRRSRGSAAHWPGWPGPPGPARSDR